VVFVVPLIEQGINGLLVSGEFADLM
jgi:hypothetical protein